MRVSVHSPHLTTPPSGGEACHVWLPPVVADVRPRAPERLPDRGRAGPLDRAGAQAQTRDREYPRAIEEFTRTLDLELGFTPTRRVLLWAYFYSGRYGDALAELDKIGGKEPDDVADRARILLASGDRAAATGLLRELEDRSTTQPISPVSLAGIYVALGDKEEALALLERAYAERDFRLRNLKTDCDWDPVHSDPRFQRLLRQVNLE